MYRAIARSGAGSRHQNSYRRQKKYSRSYATKPSGSQGSTVTIGVVGAAVVGATVAGYFFQDELTDGINQLRDMVYPPTQETAGPTWTKEVETKEDVNDAIFQINNKREEDILATVDEPEPEPAKTTLEPQETTKEPTTVVEVEPVADAKEIEAKIDAPAPVETAASSENAEFPTLLLAAVDYMVDRLGAMPPELEHALFDSALTVYDSNPDLTHEEKVALVVRMAVEMEEARLSQPLEEEKAIVEKEEAAITSGEATLDVTDEREPLKSTQDKVVIAPVITDMEEAVPEVEEPEPVFEIPTLEPVGDNVEQEDGSEEFNTPPQDHEYVDEDGNPDLSRIPPGIKEAIGDNVVQIILGDVPHEVYSQMEAITEKTNEVAKQVATWPKGGKESIATAAELYDIVKKIEKEIQDQFSDEVLALAEKFEQAKVEKDRAREAMEKKMWMQMQELDLAWRKKLAGFVNDTRDFLDKHHGVGIQAAGRELAEIEYNMREKYMGYVNNVAKVNNLCTVAFALRRAVSAHEPFETDFLRSKRFARDYKPLQASLDAVKEETVKNGVATLPALLEEFTIKAKRARRAANYATFDVKQGGIGGILTRLYASIYSITRDYTDRHTAELLSGDDALSTISRANYYLDKAQLLPAIKEISSLEEFAKKEFSGWLEDARQRALADQLVALLSAHANKKLKELGTLTMAEI